MSGAVWGENIVKFAKEFHDRYEVEARRLGWTTQESTRVEFDDLPEANKQTMLCTVAPFAAKLSNAEEQYEELIALRLEVHDLKEALKCLLDESYVSETQDEYFDCIIDNYFMLDGNVAKTLKKIVDTMGRGEQY